MKRGTRFKNGLFTFSEEALKEDREKNRSCQEITFEEVNKALNFSNKALNFTLEAPEDFKDGWIPTLDFKIWGDPQSNAYRHDFFEKSINSKWVFPL